MIFLVLKIIINILIFMESNVKPSCEIKYFQGIHNPGGYYFIGYNEIDDPRKEEVCYKFSFENKQVVRIETQQKGITINMFFSQPAVILFTYRNDMTILTFYDASDMRQKLENIDSCILVPSAGKSEKIVHLYHEGRQTTDASGRYEVHYIFRDDQLIEWYNLAPDNHLKELIEQGYAGCKIIYNSNGQIEEELFYNKNRKPAKIKGTNWSGVECASPGPDRTFYFHGIRYIYNEQNKLVNHKYLIVKTFK